MWYNTESRVVQTKNPAGSIVSEAYMKQFYPEWVQVADDFTPPVIELKPTKEQFLAELDADYKAQKTELLNQFAEDNLRGDEEAIEEDRSALADLNEWYDTEYKRIESEA